MTEDIKKEIVEVDFAKTFQDSVAFSSVVTFENESLKEKVAEAPKDQLLIVKSTVNSPKNITSVEYYDRDLILRSI